MASSPVKVAACLAVSAAVDPSLWLLGSGAIARTYLVVNAILCLGLAYLSSQKDSPATSS